MTNAKELQNEALDRAKNGRSMVNYAAIFEGFIEKGIPEGEIIPRVNVFTFNAWKAKGRVVQKGQKGVKVITYIPCEKKGKDGEEDSTFVRRKTTTVFHVSQTEALESKQVA